MSRPYSSIGTVPFSRNEPCKPPILRSSSDSGSSISLHLRLSRTHYRSPRWAATLTITVLQRAHVTLSIRSPCSSLDRSTDSAFALCRPPVSDFDNDSLSPMKSDRHGDTLHGNAFYSSQNSGVLGDTGRESLSDDESASSGESPPSAQTHAFDLMATR